MLRRDFWTAETVAWYARALATSDYAARVLEVLEPRLSGCGDALDVGAGCGALAVPLARRLGAVTALEPEPAMAAALGESTARAGLTNVTVIEARWGDVSVPPHDLVLCAHVGGLMRRDSPFLREAGTVARRLVALVRDTDDTLAGLAVLGIRPEVTVIAYRSDQPFDDLEEACDFFMSYLGLDGTAARAYLAGFLSERLVPRAGALIAPFRKAAAVISWAAG